MNSYSKCSAFQQSTVFAIDVLFIHTVTSQLFATHLVTELIVYRIRGPRFRVCTKQSYFKDVQLYNCHVC